MRPDLQKASVVEVGAAGRIEEVIVIGDVIVDAAFGGRDGGRAPSGREFGDDECS